MTIIERMRAKSATVQATAKVAEPLKEVGEARVDFSWLGHFSTYLHAIERFPEKRAEFAKQFAQQTGINFT